jgi:Sulfotransferase domain
MPIFETRIALELKRNVSLFLNLELGLTDLGAVVDQFESRLRRTPMLAKLATRLRSRVAQTPPAVPQSDGRNSTQQHRPAKQNQQTQVRKPEQPRQNAPVFFVTGLGKSGTSWLMRTLDSHPEILCKGEGRFFARDWRRENFDPAQKRALASSLYYALHNSEYLRLWIERSVWSREGYADEHLDNLTRLVTGYFLLERLSKTDKKFVGDKSPLLNAKFVEEVARVCPEAKVIHIVRDGRDQLVSMMHHMWNRSTDQGGVQILKPEELERREAYRENPQKLLEMGEGIFVEERVRQAAQSWNLRVGKTVEDGPALLGVNYTQVRYEDLLERPYEEVRRLVEFLGADTSEGAVEQAVSSASFEKLSKGRKRGQEDVTSFYRKGVAGDWKNYFSKRDKEIYKEEAGELLIRLGYEKDYDW